MEQTNTPQQPSRKKAILSLLVLLALTCVVVFIFSSHWAEISTALAQLSFWQVLLVLVNLRGTELDAANLREELQRMKLGKPILASKKAVSGKSRKTGR